jgi:hypothetical protein
LRFDADGQRVRRGGDAGRDFSFGGCSTIGEKGIFSERRGRESVDNEE